MSVIVPARDAEDTLPATLRALAAQRFDGEVEVIVVDDPDGDGPAEARNRGIARSTAPLLAFTDADCEPEPGWLAALAAALADHDLVRGPVLPVRPPGPFDRTISSPTPSWRFETANLGVRRELAERLGFARPLFVAEGHFGEDVIFGWQARRTGARIGWAADAVVRHAVFPRGPHAYLAEQRRLALFPYLVRAVPELRGEIPARVFLTRRTARFDLALAGLAAAALTRRPGPLLAALPYARERAYLPQRLHRRSVARVNLAYVAGDAIGLAALVRGSLAARRLVL